MTYLVLMYHYGDGSTQYFSVPAKLFAEFAGTIASREFNGRLYFDDGAFQYPTLSFGEARQRLADGYNFIHVYQFAR